MMKKNVVVLGLCVLLLMVSGCGQNKTGQPHNQSGNVKVVRSNYPSGKIKASAQTKNGLLDGHAEMYYESGAKMSEANYRTGVLDGVTIAYYESGAKKAEATYTEGVLNGTSVNWSEDGQKVSESTFARGVLQAR